MMMIMSSRRSKVGKATAAVGVIGALALATLGDGVSPSVGCAWLENGFVGSNIASKINLQG